MNNVCNLYTFCDLSYVPIKIEFKNVAAQPTGWEVGGGPPGAANSNLTGFF